LEKVGATYEDFARAEGVEINFVKTNLHEFLNEGPLNVEFGRFITGSWWGGFHHRISSLGCVAPLTVKKKISNLLIASSIGPEWYAWGSHWLVDNKIRWAECEIHNDGYKLSRQKRLETC